ncbi:MAG: hypothetical protein CM15mP65_10090 [Crocinitomicaceae bacterium]|nr:MAG: hypothetical protein CM15mP65_10090 [Crocinitomicaceae bacterium]
MGSFVYSYSLHYCTSCAVFSRTNLIETVKDQPYTSMPSWFNKWETTGLLTFEDKNQDRLIQYKADQSAMS